MDSRARSRALRRELESRFFRGNAPALIVSVLCMLLLTGVNLVTAWLMQNIVDVAASGGAGIGKIAPTFAAAFAVFIAAALLAGNGRAISAALPWPFCSSWTSS